MMEAAQAVARSPKRSRKRRPTIGAAEAQRLAQIPYDVMLDVTDIAERFAVRRNDSHLQPSDIDRALRFLMGRPRGLTAQFACGSIGGVLLSAGLPVAFTALVSPTKEPSWWIALNVGVGGGVALLGAVLLSIATVLTMRSPD